MANNDQALSETTNQDQNGDDLGAWITIEWDRKGQQAHWHIKNMSHQEALYVLLDVVKNCAGFALGETHSHPHHHEEAG